MKNLKTRSTAALNLGTYYEGSTACNQFHGDTAMVSNPYAAGTKDFNSWQKGWNETKQSLRMVLA